MGQESLVNSPIILQAITNRIWIMMVYMINYNISVELKDFGLIYGYILKYEVFNREFCIYIKKNRVLYWFYLKNGKMYFKNCIFINSIVLKLICNL